MGVPKRCYEHIFFDKQGIPVIVGSNIKVAELIAEKFAYGWSPEELHFQHPDLTMGQIYVALAYYPRLATIFSKPNNIKGLDGQSSKV